MTIHLISHRAFSNGNDSTIEDTRPTMLEQRSLMFESDPPQISCTAQLAELLEDADFVKTVDLVAKEAMRALGVSNKVARGFVLSAIGVPQALVSIHRAWFLAKQTGENLGLAKVIIRRRVIDLLRRDARHGNHCSLSTTVNEIDREQTVAFDEIVQRSPRAQVELQQIIYMVRAALACFAGQGHIQDRQARLLRRYALDEASYSELSAELACSENALRVRVHKAMLALRRHIRDCHSELEDLLEHDRPRASSMQLSMF